MTKLRAVPQLAPAGGGEGPGLFVERHASNNPQKGDIGCAVSQKAQGGFINKHESRCSGSGGGMELEVEVGGGVTFMSQA